MSAKLDLRLPGRLAPGVDINEEKHDPADDEESKDGKHRVAALAGGIDHGGKDERAEDASVTLKNAEECEELRRFLAWDHAGKERPAECLRPALHHSHHDRERVEVRGAGHSVAHAR